MSRALTTTAVLSVLALGALAFALVPALRGNANPELCGALSQRRLTRVYLSEGARLSCPGVETRAVPEAVQARLQSSDSQGLRALLAREKTSALALVPGQPGSPLQKQLGQLAHVPGLCAIALGPALAVYAVAREVDLSAREREALAYVARGLLRGAREPSLNAFPPSMRRVERVEVMVLLRERGEPRLWRSARGTSVARALLTATRVARDRWHEREAAMGGPLTRRLLNLDVEVSLLNEDGVLLATDPKFVDRAISSEHGLGFEYKSGWHYLLLEDVRRRGRGSAFRALTALLSDQGLSPVLLTESALRAYRFVTVTLGVSRAPLAEGDSPG